MAWLLEVGGQNALLAVAWAALALAVGRWCRRPAVRHTLWLLVLMQLITPPLWRVEVPRPALPAPEPAPEPVAVVTPPAPVPTAAAVAAVAEPEAPVEDAPAETAAPEPVAAAAVPTPALAPAAEPVAAVAPWPLVLGGAWVVGGVAWLGLALVRVWGFHRLLRYARPATPALQAQADDLARQLGLSRGPKVWLLPGAVAPMLWGLTGRARLLLPADLLGRLDAAQRAALLAHELAHYRRGDHWVRFLELAVTAAYWWHPVVWWARGELHEAEEQCCDAWVVWALPGAARSYALAVVETVDFLAGVRAALPVGASGLGRVRHLKRRVTMILTERVPRALPRAGGLAFASLALVLLPLRAGWAQQPAPRDDRREERRSEDRREERRDERRTEERRPGGDLPPERREAIERTARELHDLHEKMRELAEHIRRTEQRLAELEGRRPDAGRTQGRDGDRRPEDRRADERRTEERRATEPRQGDGGDRRGPPPGMPGGAGGPGAPAFPPGGPNFQPPGGGFPGGAGASGRGGAGGGFYPGMPGGPPGMQPPNDTERRLVELERKLDRLMQMMEERGRSDARGRDNRDTRPGRAPEAGRAPDAPRAPEPPRPPEGPRVPTPARPPEPPRGAGPVPPPPPPADVTGEAPRAK